MFSAGNGNLVSISDVDAGAASVQVQLTVTNGTLTLSGTAGLTPVAGGSGTATMTYTGTIASWNAAMAGMSYAPTANYTGAAHPPPSHQRSGQQRRRARSPTPTW